MATRLSCNVCLTRPKEKILVRFKLQSLWVFLWGYVFLGSPVLGQANDPGRFGELATSEPFQAAQYYAENNFYDQALREYERVADENPGGDLEATARLLLAEQYFQTSVFRPGDSANHAQLIAKGRVQLERVVQSFPGTRYAFVAKVMLIEGFGEDDWQREQLDPLIASVGGRTFTEILDDIPDPPFHERMILEEYRSDVAEVYDIQFRGLPAEQRDKMAVFLMESFPYTNWRIKVYDHFKRGLIPPAMSHDGVPPGMPTEPDRTAPTILSRLPESGAVTGLFPEIRVTMVDGNFWAAQTSMEESRLKLDGVDITPLAFWRMKFEPTGTNFQEVTVLYTPELPLAPGQHTLELLAVDHGLEGNSATYTWTFTVNPNHNSGPTTETLPATGDSTLIIRNPHQNEGANPRLHLKKVTGKPAQVVVGFDTSGVDTTGLTKASLVLNIDSTQNVTGWGNGRPIRAQRLLTAWTEGNGKKLGLPGNQQHSGSGSGVTWFSPIDSNISNNQADSAVNWNGGASYAAPSTAPTVNITNHQSGEVIFDVTQDLLAGSGHGWLITRDQDVGSQVTFLSRESGAPELAPKLVLEYGASTAALDSPSSDLLLATLGFFEAPKLARIPSGSELRAVREILQDSPVASMLAEQVLSELTRSNLAFTLASRMVYRSWLEQSPRLAIALSSRVLKTSYS